MISASVADEAVWEQLDPDNKASIRRILGSRLYSQLVYVGELSRNGERKHFYEIAGDSKEDIVREIFR
jgi:hypothetical protein